ncbi:putative Fe-S oxidoreductase [Achromobacter phage vB_AxyP_19-32_Axy09]|uniref:Putative Fe-S oxidoreductase n=1 Tax=Achromobacter phage vB_AxyP_19-32_Axy09 TaxID=2591040 RepID=A0A514CTS9_9CAUD|nr:putative Fe-S oxidoreductase [Achromobacter phage vB_AxyP_19-32_Axy09]
MTNTINMNLAQIQALAAEASATGPDMNVAVEGGGGKKLWASGRYLGIVLGVVELGMQPQMFGTATAAPRPEVQLTLGIWGAPLENGVPVPLHDVTTGAPYVFYPRELDISQNPKANAHKAFIAMNWQKDANVKHFAQFIGKLFIFDIQRKKNKQGTSEYMQVNWANTAAPIDVMTSQMMTPPAPCDINALEYKYFFWNKPTPQSWASLFVEGEWEAKEGKPARSKNITQEKILGALNFEGSPLHLMLEQQGIAYTRPAPQAQAAAVAPAAPAVPAPGPVPGVPGAAPLAPASVPAVAPAPTSAPVAPATPAAPVAVAPVAPVTPAAPVAAEVAAPLAPAPVAAPAAPAGPAVSAPPAIQSPSDPAIAQAMKIQQLIAAGVDPTVAAGLVAAGKV